MRNEEKPSKKLSENCRGICQFCKAFLPSNIKYMRQFFGGEERNFRAIISLS